MIIGKEGQPGGGRPVQTFALKTRGDNSLLQIEQWDGNGNLVQVSSLAPLNALQWYYAAVVNDGSTLSLYLDSGAGYELQGSVAVTEALYQAVPANPSWDSTWTIGRGEFGGGPADWFDGIIDEVRLTNSALAPSQFLFATPGQELEGDYNGNDVVDAADYTVWRDTLGSTTTLDADGSGNGTVGPEDYTIWKNNFGSTPGGGSLSANAVPEPATLSFCILAVCACAIRRQQRSVRFLETGQLKGVPVMKFKQAAWRAGNCLFGFAIVLASTAAAVEPNPLQSAYWRFEEGSEFGQVSPRNADVVLDSINDNDMRAFMNASVDAAPTYVSTVPPKPLQSGLPNTLALDFIPNQDIFALEQEINNGIIAPGGGFTVEAAFNTNNPARFAAIIGKEGQPGGGNRPLQTFVLKTRANNSNLQVEQYDGNGNVVQIQSLAPLNALQWYYVAVVNDGSTLSLYLDSGAGYELQGSVAVTEALFQGVPANPLWDANWTIGRGQFGGNPADWFDGIIDEVRITNSALAPSQFLFAPAGAGTAVPEPASIVLWIVALAACGARQRMSPRRDRRIHSEKGLSSW